MLLGIDPTVDYVFKRLFGDPNHAWLTMHLLNAIFEGRFRISGIEFQSPFLEKDFEDDKLGILDLRVRDTNQRVYNLEMQTTQPAGLTNRLAYYVASMYCDQLRESDPHTILAPAISICFLNRILLGTTSSFHTRFRMCSLEEHLELTDQLEVHLIELPKYNGRIADLPNARRLERWVYFLRNASEMILEDIERHLTEPDFVYAGGVLEMIAKTPEERLRYELRVKARRDLIGKEMELEAALQNAQMALEAGRQEGRQEGLKEGLQKGDWIGRIRVLQELLGDVALSSEEFQAWDIERLRVLAESLQSRLRERE